MNSTATRVCERAGAAESTSCAARFNHGFRRVPFTLEWRIVAAQARTQLRRVLLALRDDLVRHAGEGNEESDGRRYERDDSLRAAVRLLERIDDGLRAAAHRTWNSGVRSIHVHMSV
jgi:hypothetical protein